MFELMDSFSQTAVIKVIGVGGGGGNAVSHMAKSGIEGVEIICVSAKLPVPPQVTQNGDAPNCSATIGNGTIVMPKPIMPMNTMIQSVTTPAASREACGDEGVAGSGSPGGTVRGSWSDVMLRERPCRSGGDHVRATSSGESR